MPLAVAWVRGHHFLSTRLGPESVVVDLGAHRGEFSRELSRRYGCRCVAVEPVAALIDAAPADARIRVIREAITAVDGPVVLHLRQNPEAHTLLAAGPGDAAGTLSVAGTTWASLRRRAGLEHVALLKLDIEGTEVDLLRTLAPAELQAIEQITVEFHPEAVGGDAPIRAVVQRLESLGFWPVRFSRGFGDVLLVNQAVFRLTLPQRLWLRHVIRNGLGLRRVVRRWIGSVR